MAKKSLPIGNDDFTELHGDRFFGDDPAMIGGIGFINGLAVTIIGNQKGRTLKETIERNGGMSNPEGYRKALRLAKQAEKFHRPIITFIDTQGAYPGLAAEERGIGEAIAVNLREFSQLKTPVICIIIGEGGSGGALGIGVGDKIYMLENAIYSVISPEGCASILLRDSSRAKDAAAMMKITSREVLGLKVINGVIPEAEGGAHRDPLVTANAIRERIISDLADLRRRNPEVLVKYRNKKIRETGAFYDDDGGRSTDSMYFYVLLPAKFEAKLGAIYTYVMPRLMFEGKIYKVDGEYNLHYGVEGEARITLVENFTFGLTGYAEGQGIMKKSADFNIYNAFGGGIDIWGIWRY